MCANPSDARPGAQGGIGPALAWLLGVWLLPGLAASAWLLHLFDSDAAGTALHAVVLLALLLTVLLPALPELLRNAPWSRWALRLTSAGLATVHLGLLLFYGLAWAGHRFWGNWINLELALAYLPQLPGLMQALGLGLHWAALAVLALLLAWWALWALHGRLLQRLVQARQQMARTVNPGLGLGLLLCLVASLMLMYRSFYLDLDFWWYEPLRQASHSASFGQAGMGIALSPENLQAEQAAVAAYTGAPPTSRRRPLVLIIVDALRSDVTGAYGAPIDNTPFLSSLVRSGQMQAIEDAYSVCTVSYCGILGTLASRHWHQMTPQPWGLADALARSGYESRFYLSGDHTSFYGLRTMYGSAPSLVIDGGSQKARYSNDDRLVLDALDTHGWPKEHPGFLYVHLMSAHRLGLVDEAYKRWNSGNAPTYSRFGTLAADDGPESRARYHNGILQADAMIERIFQRLAKLKVLDEAMVIITADHGEFIGEGGQWSHGHMPFEPVVRIPLLVYDRLVERPLPARRLASHIDIAPTFLQAIGAPVPAHWAGVPLQRAMNRDSLLLDSAEAVGLVADEGQGRYKYLRPRDGSPERLYLLKPGHETEAVDLARNARQADQLARLRLQHQHLLGLAP